MRRVGHWKRLKQVASIKGGAGFPHEEQGVHNEELPFYKVASLEGATANGELAEADHRVSRETARRLGAHVFRPGTVVFAKVGAALLLNRFRQLGAESCLDNNMMGLEPFPDQIAPRYLMYAMVAKDLGLIVNPGAVPSVNGSQVAEEKVWCPSLAHQLEIANFLDDKTARIDALIAEKKQLQGAMEEWRAAELTRLCFGDLASAVPTGNAWITGLPQGWRLARLKHLISGIEQGWSPECEARLAEPSEWGVLKAGASNGGVYRENEHKALPATLAPLHHLEVKSGDVLVSRASGSADLVGSFAFVYETRPHLMLSDKNFRLKFTEAPPLLPELLAWMCNTEPLRQQVRQYVSGADGLAKNIGSSSLRELWVAVPPRLLQPHLVSELRSLKAKLDRLESHLSEHISRLREYRSSLISAAVTGQLDLGADPGRANELQVCALSI